jgi:aspartate 1-decarboxylase
MLILLFNIGGYRIAIYLLQYHSDDRLEAMIDEEMYDESQLLEIRVALNMPYQQRFTDFERHYGHIEIDGKAYTYVKRKIEGDVVIFKCIANESKEQFRQLRDELARANSSEDMSPVNQKRSLSFAKNFWSEYDRQLPFQLTTPFCTLHPDHAGDYQASLLQADLNTPHQPPEMA